MLYLNYKANSSPCFWGGVFFNPRMKFIRKHWSNILFFGLLILMVIPQTRMPIQVFIQRAISFSPSEEDKETRKTLNNYNWNLLSLDDLLVNFSSSKEKVVLVNFWATWCPPCVAEMPSLQKLYEVYGDKIDFYFITSEEPEKVKAFITKNKYSFPVYLQKFKAPDEIKAEVLPTTYVLSKSGEIVVDEEGVADWNSEKFKKLVEALLAE